ncbi:hypothetical protein OAE49_06355 [Gammaproteobacteria bacterium]|nr:hypothetical protein [Gammaproteobacteria bacterium]
MSDNTRRTDGRTDKEIRIIAISGDITNLTNKQYDRHLEMEAAKKTVTPKKFSKGGVCRGQGSVRKMGKFKVS